MYLRSLKGCRLAIGNYPPFHYDARNGGGKASLTKKNSNKNIIHVNFSPEGFSIPPLTSKTTRFLGLPLPPGFKIKMNLDILEGTINNASGEILLNFKSRFIFTIGSKYTFPELFVKTCLHTGKIKSRLYKEEGLTLQKDGRTTLIGVAKIAITGNKILDIFLGLPNEALAVLKCEIK